MPTGYFLPENGARLRHAHGGGKWHEASDHHEHSTPDEHTLHDSWNPDTARWAKDNARLPNALKVKLISQAKQAYDTYADAPSFNPVPLAQQQPQQQQQQQAPPDFLARLSDVEELSTAAAMASNAAAEQSDKLATQLNEHINTQRTAAELIANKITALENQKQRTTRHEIYDRDANTFIQLDGHKHKDFTFALTVVRKAKRKRRNFWLAGPAGSGKSTLVEQIAEALSLSDRFFPQPPILNVLTQLIGYRDINNNVVRTQFREVFEHGGVILFDECDASSPEAMVVLNQALANGVYAFPDAVVKRHPKCYIFAAANTMGAGADANYNARFKQDDAFMDRFFTIDMDYDEILEKTMLDEYAHEWVSVVQQVRAAARLAGGELGFVISPRASEKGADLLYGDDTDDPMSPEQVVRAIFGRYRTHEKWPHIGRAAEEFARKSPVPARPRNNGAVPSTSTPGANLSSMNFRSIN